MPSSIPRPVLALIAALAPLGVAHAYEFRVRFIEQIGPSNFEVLADNTVNALDLQTHRVRVQFGVFDDATGPAPAGGYVGWNVGSISVQGGPANSNESRTPGRLAPFTFAPAAGGANGVPAADPLEEITNIDNTLGTQAAIWRFGEPMPLPIIRGLNTFISTYEITVDPVLGPDYTIDFAGNLIAALEWRTVGDPTPPKGPKEAGNVTYAPFADVPRSFSATLVVRTTPSPGAVSLLSLGVLAALRRRRGSAS
jgi:MYXO-CTERM domain-containing protein